MNNRFRSMRRVSAMLLVVCSVAASAAAGEARVAVDPGLAAAAPPLVVSGVNPRRWGADLAFGPWHATEVRAGDLFGWFFAVGELGTGAARSATRMTLAGPVGITTVACISKRWVLGKGSFSVDLAFGRRPILACGFEGDDGARWTLSMSERAPRFVGTLQNVDGASDSLITVRSIHRLEGSGWTLADPAGYELTLAGQVVATVETINRGRVWMDQGLDDGTKQQVAAAAAVLLLFEPPEVD